LEQVKFSFSTKIQANESLWKTLMPSFFIMSFKPYRRFIQKFPTPNLDAHQSQNRVRGIFTLNFHAGILVVCDEADALRSLTDYAR
jgi:hypothetical protein